MTTPSPYCNATQSHCADRRQCLAKDQFCNFKEECNDHSDELSCPQVCTFEGPTTCLWTNDNRQKLKWSFGNGKTASTDTGPSHGKSLGLEFYPIDFFVRVDHTLNSVNGTYIYLETSSGLNGDRARLISPLYIKSSKTCSFTFW